MGTSARWRKSFNLKSFCSTLIFIGGIDEENTKSPTDS